MKSARFLIPGLAADNTASSEARSTNAERGAGSTGMRSECCARGARRDRAGAVRPDYLIATALTCLKSVRPSSDLRTPSCTSVVMPSSLATLHHLGHARLRLDEPLHLVGGDQQLVDTQRGRGSRSCCTRRNLCRDRGRTSRRTSALSVCEASAPIRLDQLVELGRSGWYPRRQSLQMRLTSRWAMMPSSASAKLNGSMPMSSRRVIVSRR